jgi:hypothetical protein
MGLMVDFTTPVSIDNTALVEPDKISLDTGDLPATPPLPEAARTRSFKASVALPNLTQDAAYNSIISGQEDMVRKQGAAEIDWQKSIQRERVIQEIAARSNRPLTGPEVSMVDEMIRNPKPTQPYSVFEEYYSAAFLKQLEQTGDIWNTGWYNSVAADQKERIFYGGRNLGTTLEWLQTQRENSEAVLSQQSYIGRSADFFKNFIPFYAHGKQLGAEFNFLGQGLEAKMQQALALPTDKAIAELKPIIDNLNANNPALAVSFVNAMLGHSSREKLMDNISTVLDASVFKPIAAGKLGAAVIKSAIGARELNTAVKTALADSVTLPASSASMASAAGDLTTSAVRRVGEIVMADFSGKSNQAKTGMEGLVSLFNTAIKNIEEHPGGLNREQVVRLTDRYAQARDQLADTVMNSVKVNRVPILSAVETELTKVLTKMSTDFPGMEGRILDIGARRDPLTGLVAEFITGDQGATLFRTRKAAESFAKTIPVNVDEIKPLAVSKPVAPEAGAYLPTTQVLPKGMGYYVKFSIPLDETSSVVRDALLRTQQAETPSSILNAFGGMLGSIRTPDETLSLFQRMNRKAATYGPSKLLELLADSSKEISQMKSWFKGNLPFTSKREKWNQWQSVVDSSLKERDPSTGRTGRLLAHPQALNEYYMNKLGRLPDEQETAAYFSYKRAIEIRKTLQSWQEYKARAREGAQTYTIKAIDEAADFEGRKSVPLHQAEFDAVPLKEFPREEDTILIADPTLGREIVTATSKVTGNLRKMLTSAIKNGEWKALRVINPGERPFQNFGTQVGSAHVRYVLTENVEAKALSWRDVDHLPAEYNHSFHVKQAVMYHDRNTGFRWYEGDRALGAFDIRAHAVEFAGHLDEVRKLIKDNKIYEAEAYKDGSNLPLEFNTVHSWFKPEVTPEGLTIPPRLNLDEPIQVVARHQRVIDLGNDMANRHGDKLRDGSKPAFGKFARDFYDPNDVITMGNRGTVANPLYDVQPVKHLDPITAINRSLSKIVNSAFMDDYKIFSVEHWIQEAKPYLDKATAQELAESPYYFFYNPSWKNVSGEAATRVSNLQTARYQIQQLLGVSNPQDTFLHSVAQKLADSLYEAGYQRMALAPLWALPTLRDPFAFIRSATFHSTLGLFNPVQFWVQANSFVNIFGIAGPKYAVPGTKAMLLHQWSRFNSSPEVLAQLDKLASTRLLPGTSVWRPGEFTEARQLGMNTGFFNVAHEHALRDNVEWFNAVRGARDDFLRWGAIPFTEGERASRIGSWYTAYREFRDANPTGKISDIQGQGILERADTLYTNMSRASSSTLHQGIFSIPTQFLSYQLRLAELFLGKRLTGDERMRLFGTYFAVYGFPVALGVTGLPMKDLIRKWAHEDGYNVGEDYAKSLVYEGIPSFLAAMATGKGDASKGNWYNFGGRFGPSGLFGDALRSDKTVWEIVSGAAGTKFRTALERTDGFSAAVMPFLRGEGNLFKIEDFVDPIKEISTVNTVERFMSAVNTGKWFSKKEGYLTEVSKGNAAFMSIFGLQPQEVEDMYAKIWTKDQEKQVQKEALASFTREYRRAIQAQADNNPNQFQDYMKRAFRQLVRSGYPEEKWSEAVSIATEGYESVINKTNWDYYLKDVPENRKPTARDAFTRWLRLQQGKQ